MGQKIWSITCLFGRGYKFTPCPCNNHTLQVTKNQSSKAQTQSTNQAKQHTQWQSQSNACKHAKLCFVWKSGSYGS